MIPIGGMNLKRSRKFYREPEKQAVVDRYNEMFDEKSGQEADWGEIFAELIEAYIKAKP